MEEGELRKERLAAVVGKAGKACFLRSSKRTVGLVIREGPFRWAKYLWSSRNHREEGTWPSQSERAWLASQEVA